VALGAVGAALVGCGPVSRPLVVAVRDAQTHAPLVGAGVEADSLALGTSLEVSDLLDDVLGRRAVLESKGITDSRGEAHVAYSPGRTISVVVLVTDGPPARLTILHDFDAGPTGWLTPLQWASKPAAVEVRAGRE
jgi:hypothetical protein